MFDGHTCNYLIHCNHFPLCVNMLISKCLIGIYVALEVNNWSMVNIFPSQGTVKTCFKFISSIHKFANFLPWSLYCTLGFFMILITDTKRRNQNNISTSNLKNSDASFITHVSVIVTISWHVSDKGNQFSERWKVIELVHIFALKRLF